MGRAGRLPEPRLVTFDLGNVLTMVDEGPPTREYARLAGAPPELVHRVCFDPRAKRPLETGEVTFAEFARSAIDGLGLRIGLARFTEIFNSSLTPNVAVFGLVERVASRYRVALCSNTSDPHWTLERGRLPFARMFDPAVLSYRVGAMKPDRRIYDAISDMSGVAHEDIVFIDDAPQNVEGARATGIRAIHYTSVERLESDLAAAGVVIDRGPGEGR
jgi:putative hydrolase of the HAD superfamily